jgi:hypothetical protein
MLAFNPIGALVVNLLARKGKPHPFKKELFPGYKKGHLA